jgi:hypothetical protein
MQRNLPLTIAGVVLVILGVLNHFTQAIKVTHLSIGLAAVGIVLLAVGLILGTQATKGRR